MLNLLLISENFEVLTCLILTCGCIFAIKLISHSTEATLDTQAGLRDGYE